MTNATLPTGYSIETEYGFWYVSGPADSTIDAEEFSSEAEAIAAAIADAGEADTREAEAAERRAENAAAPEIRGDCAMLRGMRAAMRTEAEQDARAAADPKFAIARHMERRA